MGRTACSPVQLSYLVRKYNSLHLAIRWQRYLEGIALSLSGDGADDGQPGFGVIACRGKYQGRAMAGLLATGLRRKVHPYNVSCVRNVLLHQSSLPTGWPQSASEWRFSGVMAETSSFRVRRLRRAVRTSSPGLAETSISRSPSCKSACFKVSLGILTARLL